MPLASLQKSYETDSDWALVIKLNAYLEATLNFLIVRHFGDARLESVIPNLDLSDPKRGKIAFVKALDLLPKAHRSFIHKLAELRNKVVHNVKNVDLDLKAYLDQLDSKQFEQLNDAVIPILAPMVLFIRPFGEERASQHLKKEPRNTLLLCAAAIMLLVYEKHQVRDLLTGDSSMPPESSPKG